MKLVVGISGASGAIYGLRILEVLKLVGVETHLVMSDSAKRTIVYETDHTIEAVKNLATPCMTSTMSAPASLPARSGTTAW